MWRPVLSDSGLTGHRFDLVWKQIEAHLEVLCPRPRFIAWRSSIASSRRSHARVASDRNAARVQFTLESLDSAQGLCGHTRQFTILLPINELAVGRELHAAELHIDPRHERNPVVAWRLRFGNIRC